MLKMYAVHDAKAEAYLQPFFTKTRGLASRMFTNTVNDEKTEFWKHPEDYTLFEIGDYDEDKGIVTPAEKHYPIGESFRFQRNPTIMQNLIKSLMKQHEGANRNVGFFINKHGEKYNEITISNEAQLLKSAPKQTSNEVNSTEVMASKTTFDSGDLVPVFVDEALPGDTFNCRMSAFARLATPIVPVMDNLYCDSFFFAVPIRLVWDNWEKFNGAQDNPADSTDYLVPTMDSPASVGHLVGSLSDYFGIPTDIPDLTHSSLWHRAYNLIWNEWFRDENLQDSLVVDTDDGPDTSTDYVVKKRGKRHDYFTSSLPWAQKGDSVTLPLGTSADVKINNFTNTTGDDDWYVAITDGSNQGFHHYGTTAETNTAAIGTSTSANLYADLSTATASTINALRQSFQIQKIYERDARGGTRYTEIIKSHFGVTSPDARLQRPEFLGGATTPINISPIAQTSSTDATTPQGNLAAIGTMSNYGAGFTKSFTEHCLLIGLVSVRADLNYQQGLNRMFSRQTRWDFYWPALSHIGEQAILNKEIYAQGSLAATDDNVFGYQERYAEYRYKPSVITGQFRSTYSTPLDYWHLAQEFSSLPTLNDTFIQEAPPVDRIVANTAEPEFLLDAYFNLKTARPMPTYSVPGLIDHF